MNIRALYGPRGNSYRIFPIWFDIPDFSDYRRIRFQGTILMRLSFPSQRAHYLVWCVSDVAAFNPKSGEYEPQFYTPEVLAPNETSLDWVIQEIYSGQYENLHSVIQIDLHTGRCDDCSRMVAELVLDRAETELDTLPEYVINWIDQYIDLTFNQHCRLRGLDPKVERENNAADDLVKIRKAVA